VVDLKKSQTPPSYRLYCGGRILHCDGMTSADELNEREDLKLSPGPQWHKRDDWGGQILAPAIAAAKSGQAESPIVMGNRNREQ